MFTDSLDIKNSLQTQLVAVLPVDYVELKYLNNVSRNTFRNCENRYGVIARDVSQASTVTKQITYLHNYEIVITKGYCESSLDDIDAVSASYDLREIVLDYYKRIINTKGGIPSKVMNILDLSISPPEYLEDEKVTVLRANFNVLYRTTLL